MTCRPRRVVVVAYGSAPLLSQTLAALGADEQVTVIDNSSSPAIRSAAEVANVKYLDPGENLGFAGAVNIALRDLRQRADDADVLLLNPDARITSEQIDRLQSVLGEAGNENVACVSPALASPEGVEQRVLWPYPSPARMWREASGLSRLIPQRKTKQFVVGAVLLLRREALAAVGHFDERYFLYAEETDWQRRALDLGWRSLVVPEVTALHVGAGTSVDSGRRDRLFHAGQETYIRRWFGPMGWSSYRLAALSGAVVRAALNRGVERRSAWARARLYLNGPRRRVGAAPPRGALRVTHVVVTGNAAGTERYVAETATLQAAAGHRVTVVGGDPIFMRGALSPAVIWCPGETPRIAGGALRDGGSQDIVHAHLTSADLVAVLTLLWHGARVVSTRHIAKRRGSRLPVRLVFRVINRWIAVDVSISEYVRQAIGTKATVLPNGVRSDAGRAGATTRTVLLAQRLEAEKGTEIALLGWAASGLAARGWTFVICGDGSKRESLQRLAKERGIAGVEWRGWVADLRAAMRNATVLLAPAPGEPLGLTVLEAMSVGLPVVAAAAGGHLETIGLCPQAMLFAPGDAQDCGTQLARAGAMSADELSSYGAGLKQLQQSRFDVIEHVGRLDAIYRSVLG